MVVTTIKLVNNPTTSFKPWRALWNKGFRFHLRIYFIHIQPTKQCEMKNFGCKKIISSNNTGDHIIYSARQTDRQTYRQKDRQTNGRTDKWTDRQTEIDRRTERQTDKRTNRQMDRQTDRRTDRQTDRKTDTNRQTEIDLYYYLSGGLAQLVATLVRSTKLLYARPG